MAFHDPFDDDVFSDSRMTFGEHIEELRKHLLLAIKGLIFFLFIGFILDAIGTTLDLPKLGIGRPMMGVITDPVREQLRAFYNRKIERLMKQRDEKDPTAIALTALKPVKMRFGPEQLGAIRGVSPVGLEPVEVELMVDPLALFAGQRSVQETIRPELTVLSVQEGMVVYIKVSLLCSLILASPWVFYQLWAFVAAGLYPHEKHYVHKFLPISLGLFLGGVFLCQFAVIPRSIEALLWFNEWLDYTPDLRLSEWLGFAIMLPLVFGVSFQTPLVMLFLERIGITSIAGYWSSWRMSAFILAIAAAIITPTPDAFTMLAMWLPLVGLYFLGIGFCYWGRRPETADADRDELIEA